MYCPECGSEYREGFFECVDCRVPLTHEPPVLDEPTPDVELVTVFEESDLSRLAVAESLLTAANIPYVKRGEISRTYLGSPSLYNAALGPIALEVAEPHAKAALELLTDLTPQWEPGEAPDPPTEPA